MTIAVLVSGRGSNLQAIIDAIESKKLKAKIEIVISDREAPAIDRCKRHNIKNLIIKPSDFNSREDYEEALVETLSGEKIQLVVLAGFMRVLGERFLKAFSLKAINIHPAITPAFPGIRAQKKALEFGALITGCSVHFIQKEVDMGPVIIQACVAIEPQDSEESLSQKILNLEHRCLLQAISWILAGRVEIEGRKVLVKGAKYGTLPFNPALEEF
ncbi:MAG: phosphoribosylglycinamide formyltransferase [Aquificaceae bacterium]